MVYKGKNGEKHQFIMLETQSMVPPAPLLNAVIAKYSESDEKIVTAPVGDWHPVRKCVISSLRCLRGLIFA